MRTGLRGFTLIELLIVCAVIAILAGIGLSNMQEASVRSKVSRVKADMRSLVVAVESYAVDYNKYPIRHHFWEMGGQELDDGAAAMFHHAPHAEKVFDPDNAEVYAPVGLHVMTTPVGYITSLPHDVFNRLAASGNELVTVDCGCGTTHTYERAHGGSDHIDYYDPIQTDKWLSIVSDSPFIRQRANGYMLLSVGPDEHLGITNEPYSQDFTQTPIYGYPLETPWTLGTEKAFYDPTNGIVSTGNIYYFSGGLTQQDILRPAAANIEGSTRR